MFLSDLLLLYYAHKVNINNQEKVKRILTIRCIARLFCLFLFVLLYFTIKKFPRKYTICMMMVSSIYIVFHLTISRLVSRYMYNNPTQNSIASTNNITDVIITLLYIGFMIKSYYSLTTISSDTYENDLSL